MVRKLVFVLGLLSCFQVHFGQPIGNYPTYSMFIYNFIKYTEWPVEIQEMTIGVLNNEMAAESLDKMAKAKSKPGGMQIKVKNFANVEDLDNCQVIFIPTTSNSKCQKVGDRYKGKSVLIITEEPDMLSKGSSISFKIVEGKPRFQINKDLLKSSGLKMSSSIVNLGI